MFGSPVRGVAASVSSKLLLSLIVIQSDEWNGFFALARNC